MSNSKVIVTVAPTVGMASKKQNPSPPTQPQETADDVYSCYNLGASLVPVHERRPDDQVACDLAIYSDIKHLIRVKCDTVLNNSTDEYTSSYMVHPDINSEYFEIRLSERLKGMERQGGEMRTVDAQTLFASFGGKEIMVATMPSRIRQLVAMIKGPEIKLECQVFSLADVMQDVSLCIEKGLDKVLHFINIVFGFNAFRGTLPHTPRLFVVKQLGL